MPLDPKLEKKIDTLYRNTKLMPLVALLGIFVPILLIACAPLGLLYWSWRRNLLREADSGTLQLDSVPPMPQQGELSTAAKLDLIRSRNHSLLMPCYVLSAVVIAIVCLLLFVALTQPKS